MILAEQDLTVANVDQNFNIVLYEPVIPQNTGSIARLCACTGARLHLIRPLGFDISERAVKRAGLDYWPFVQVKDHENWQTFLDDEKPQNLYFFSKFGEKSYATISFAPRSYLVFGSETTGLPGILRARYADQLYRVPMRTHLVRSLNLSQCAAVVLYEALRQAEFTGINAPLCDSPPFAETGYAP